MSFMQAAAAWGAEEAHHPCKSKGSFVNTTSDSTSASVPALSLSLSLSLSSTTHLASRSSVGAFFITSDLQVRWDDVHAKIN